MKRTIKMTKQNNKSNRRINKNKSGIIPGVAIWVFAIAILFIVLARADIMTFNAGTVLVTVVSPENNSNLNTNSISFNVTSNDTISWCGVSINGLANSTMTLNASFTRGNYTNSSIADGSYSFRISCNDSLNTYGASASYNFLVDTGIPTLNVSSPLNESTYNNQSVFFNITSSETGTGNGSIVNDLDRSLVLWMTMDSRKNATYIYDNSTWCYDNETEIMTENGWKYFYDLESGEKVMTLNAETGNKELQLPVEKQVFDNNNDMYKITLEDGSDLVVSSEHRVYSTNYLNKLSGYEINLNGERINNLPLNSESLTCLSNLDNNEKVVSISGESILNTTIPKCSSGGNNLLLIKCLSNVSIILDSDLDIFDTCLSDEPSGLSLTSCPSCNNSLLIATGKFSSERNLSLLLDESILLFSDDFRSICQDRKDSRFCNMREISLNNFFNADSCSEQFHNLPDHNSCAFESRGSTTNFTVRNNIAVNFSSHDNTIKSSIFKSYDSKITSFSLQKVTDVYSDINAGKEVYFLNENNKPVKVKSITKQDYTGKIYDVDVKNDIVLVRRENGTAVWSGNSNNGTVVGNASYTSAGKRGGAMSFDGASGRITVLKSNSLDFNTTFTVSAWANFLFNSTTTYNRIISKGGQTASIGGFELMGINNKFSFYLSNGTTLNTLSTVNVYSKNNWHNVVGVWNGTDMLIYVNGVFENSKIQNTYSNSSSYNLIIGRNGIPSYQYWNGSIDDVMIFNRSLSADEIAGLYNATKANYNITLSDGSHTLKTYTQDLAGNINSSNFTTFWVDTTFPTATLISPLNNTYANNGTQNFTVNLSDNIGIKNSTLNIYNATSNLVNQTTITYSAGTLTKTLGIVVTLVDGVYNWFYNLVDFAGNGFTTGNYTETMDLTYPQINIVYPINNTNSSNNKLNINYTISDINLQACWYSNDTFTQNITQASCANITAITWSEGQHNVTLWVNDSANNVNTTSVRFTIDTIYPLIDYHSTTPTDGANLSQTFIPINISITEINLKNVTFRYYNASDNYAQSYTINSNHTFISISDGIYYYNFTACDFADNCNTTISRKITLDTISPTISYGAGTAVNYANLSQNWTYINVTYTEINFANITFSLYNSTWSNITTFATPTYTINFTNIADGRYWYFVNITDLANNKNSTAVYNITLDTTLPNATLISPLNNTYTNNATQNFTVNLSDNIGIKNATLNIYNATSDLINQTTEIYEPGTLTKILGIVVTLVDGVYNWFYNLFDFAGNGFTSGNYTLKLNRVAPNITLSTPVRNSNLSNTNTGFNFTAIDDNPENMNCSLYIDGILRSSNLSVVNNTITSINTSNFTGGNHSWNITCTDAYNNINWSSSTYEFYTDIYPPNFTGIVYSLTARDDLDPMANLSFNVTVFDSDLRVPIDSVILQYYNGTGWTNSTMSNNSASNYNTTITLDAINANYTFNIWANDSLSNANSSVNQTFAAEWDCNWTYAITGLGAVSGWDINKPIGNITLINLGDPAYSDDNCSLSFHISHNIQAGRIYFNNWPSNKFVTYYDTVSPVSAKTNATIVVNGSFLSQVLEDSSLITIRDLSGISSLSLVNTTAILVSTTGGPYLYSDLETYSTALYLTPQNTTVTGYTRNVMGNDTDSNTAFNVSLNWTLPAELSRFIKDGSQTMLITNLSDSLKDYNSLNLSLNSSNLPGATPGTYAVYLYSSGYNSSGDTINHADNKTLLSKQFNITLVCYTPADRVYVTACETLDGDYAVPSAAPSSGGGGGGGGVAGGQTAVSSESFELVRGKEQEFEFEVKNKYEWDLENLKISVSGIESRYIEIIPNAIDFLAGKTSEKVIVKINAPEYFTEKQYVLKFVIQGTMIQNTSKVSYMETKTITLNIIEQPKEEVDIMLNDSGKMIEEMRGENMSLVEVNKLLGKINEDYSSYNFANVKTSYEGIKAIYNAAFGSKSLISELEALVKQADVDGVSVIETKKLLYTAESIYKRGDYLNALKKLQEAKLTYALEVKGEFNLIYAVKNKPLESFGILLLLGFFGFGSSLLLKFKLYKKKIKILGEEEEIILGLMKVIQKECFEEARLSMEEYEEAMSQYEKRLRDIVNDKISTQTKLANLLKIGGTQKALGEERKKLVEMIREVQEQYLRGGKLETRVYENIVKSYTTRLTEVEEQIAFADAQKALRGYRV